MVCTSCPHIFSSELIWKSQDVIGTWHTLAGECCKANSWECHKVNSLGCHKVNSHESGGGIFLVITLSCCHLTGVVHTIHIWWECDTVNSKYGGKWVMMPNMVGILACNGLRCSFLSQSYISPPNIFPKYTTCQDIKEDRPLCYFSGGKTFWIIFITLITVILVTLTWWGVNYICFCMTFQWL